MKNTNLFRIPRLRSGWLGWRACRAISILVFSICFLVSCASNGGKKVETAKVTRGDILAELPTTGVVIPRNRLEIKPPVAGRIEEVLVKEGVRVNKGDILAWMSSSERAALLDAARAKSPEEVKKWEDVYRPAPIMAPLAGFVIKRNMEQGQFFGVSDIVMVMADRLILQAQIDETDIGRIKLAQKATIIMDAYPDEKIPGTVEQIAYESETINNVTVYKVNVLPQIVPPFLRSGMSATVAFNMEEKNGVLILPLSAVKKKGGRAYVFTNKDGSIKTLQVEAGLETNDSVEIVSGLSEGEEVIIPTQKMVQNLLERNNRRQPMNPFGKKK